MYFYCIYHEISNSFPFFNLVSFFFIIFGFVDPASRIFRTQLFDKENQWATCSEAEIKPQDTMDDFVHTHKSSKGLIKSMQLGSNYIERVFLNDEIWKQSTVLYMVSRLTVRARYTNV